MVLGWACASGSGCEGLYTHILVDQEAVSCLEERLSHDPSNQFPPASLPMSQYLQTAPLDGDIQKHDPVGTFYIKTIMKGPDLPRHQLCFQQYKLKEQHICNLISKPLEPAVG